MILIKLKIADKEIELTKEQAIELKQELDSLFNKEQSINPYYVPYAKPLWQWDSSRIPHKIGD